MILEFENKPISLIVKLKRMQLEFVGNSHHRVVVCPTTFFWGFFFLHIIFCYVYHLIVYILHFWRKAALIIREFKVIAVMHIHTTRLQKFDICWTVNVLHKERILISFLISFSSNKFTFHLVLISAISDCERLQWCSYCGEAL